MQPEHDSKRPGEGDRCPVCGSTSGLVSDDEGYLCIVCGAPRVLVTSRIPRPGGEKPLLERAKQLRLQRAGWTIAASAAAVAAVVAFVLGGLIALLRNFGDTGRIAWSATVLIPMIVALLSYRKVAQANAGARTALEEAEVVITEELVRARGALDAAEVASLLGVPLERAEALVGRAQVDRMLEQEQPAPARQRVQAGATDEAEPAAAAKERDRTR